MACRDRVGQLQDEFPSRSPKVDVVEHVLHFTTPLVSRKVTALHPEGRVITYTSNGLYCALACIDSTGHWCFHRVMSARCNQKSNQTPEILSSSLTFCKTDAFHFCLNQILIRVLDPRTENLEIFPKSLLSSKELYLIRFLIRILMRSQPSVYGYNRQRDTIEYNRRAQRSISFKTHDYCFVAACVEGTPHPEHQAATSFIMRCSPPLEENKKQGWAY